MSFTTLTTNLNNHQSLGDRPNTDDSYTAAALKTLYDKAANDIKTYINSTLLAELQAQGASANLGAVVGGIAGKIQDFIDQVESAGVGTLPPSGSVTNVMMATDVKIGSLAALTTTDKTSVVNAIKELVTSIASSSHTIPTGIISMWSGLITAIPSGWAFCDGTNGTPDLRDRMIAGATNQSEMNTSGGSNTKTLTTTQLPAHTHTGTTNAGGIHSHTYTEPSFSQGAVGGVGSYASTANTTTTGDSTAHTHTFTTGSTGTGAAFDIRPKYYKMAFIMKV